jgi:hypothetical protein
MQQIHKYAATLVVCAAVMKRIKAAAASLGINLEVDLPENVNDPLAVCWLRQGERLKKSSRTIWRYRVG